MIEVLIAVSLLASIMLLVTSGLRTISVTWRSGLARFDSANRMLIVSEFLYSHTSRMLPLASNWNGMGFQTNFKGDANHFKFVAEMPASSDFSGLFEFEIYADQEHENHLKLRMSPYKVGHDGVLNQSDEIIDVVTILSGVENFYISYFSDEEGGEGKWDTEWGKPYPPDMVQFHIVTKLEGAWPDIKVPIRTRVPE